MPYATRYVAFVDILGFRGIVNKSRDSEQMVEELANVRRCLLPQLWPGSFNA
jgi:hypothetical protein